MKPHARVAPEGRWWACARYPGYLVNESGEVWSEHRHKFLRGTTRGNYRVVCIRGGTGGPFKLLHRLALEFFSGEEPAGRIACHINGDPSDNSHDNLRWDSHAGNCADRKRHGTNAEGARHGSAVLTDAQVLAIRARNTAGVSMAKLAREYGVTHGTVARVVNGKSWLCLAVVSTRAPVQLDLFARQPGGGTP